MIICTHDANNAMKRIAKTNNFSIEISHMGLEKNILTIRVNDSQINYVTYNPERGNMFARCGNMEMKTMQAILEIVEEYKLVSKPPEMKTRRIIFLPITT